MAQLNRLNGSSVLVSIYNPNRIVTQKFFDSELKALNYCKKYGYEILPFGDGVEIAEMYNQ